MNERIGTYCEKCREVVCRCAEHKVATKRLQESIKNGEFKVAPEFINIFGDVAYFKIETGAVISVNDYQSLSTAQQEKCTPVYLLAKDEIVLINEDIEKAAQEYIKKEDIYSGDRFFAKECFKAGVVWQEEQHKEPYGWCIEVNTDHLYSKDAGKTYIWSGFTGWYRYFSHKVYKTKEIALEAVNAIKNSYIYKDSKYTKIKFRIFPVYQGKIEEL